MARHKDEVTGSIHIPYEFEYANENDRINATGFETTDIGKLAKQTNNNSLWMLTDIAPLWKRVSPNLLYHDYIEDDSTSSTTATSFQDKLSFSIIPDGEETFLIEISFELLGDTVGMIISSRWGNDSDSVVYNNLEYYQNIANQNTHFQSFKRITISAEKIFKLQYRSDNAANTAEIRNARVVVYKVI